MSAPLLVHITVTVKAEDKDKLLEALRGVFDKIVAEPKCVYLNVFESSLQPGRVKVVEMWDAPRDWFVNELSQRDWYRPFMETVDKLLIEPRDFETLSGVEGLKYMKSPS